MSDRPDPIDDVRAALEQSEERFRQLTDSARVIFWEADLQEGFTYVGPQAEEILGYPLEDWYQEGFFESHLDPSDRERVERRLRSETNSGAELEYRLRAADGRQVWVRDHVRFVTSAGGRRLLRGFMFDITETRRAEAALDQREEQLRRVQHLEAIGRLAGGVAHDFNNYLTAISGYSELMLQALDEDQERLRRYATRINEAGQRATSLTQQLLAVGRKKRLQSADLDLNDLLRSAEEALRSLLGESVELVFELDPNLGLVHVDPQQLQKIVLNLSSNAQQAMPTGGRLKLTTLEEDVGGDRPELSPGAYVVLELTDTGCGMDPETRARCLEPFFTTRSRGAGTGLGLSSAYGTIRQSGGWLDISSASGQGTTITIYLPRIKTATWSPSPATVPTARVHTQDATILVVEDSEAVRGYALEVLEANGYRVIEVSDPVEARDVVRDNKVDLLVTDVVMPKLSGPQVVAQVKSIRPDLPVIYMSGYAEDDMSVRSGIDPQVPFLAKPFRPTALLERVHEALHQ